MSDDEFGWCPACNSTCFVLFGTCRGCGAKSVPIPPEAWKLVNQLTNERGRLRERVVAIREAAAPFVAAKVLPGAPADGCLGDWLERLRPTVGDLAALKAALTNEVK